MKFFIKKRRLLFIAFLFSAFSFSVFAQGNNEERYRGVETGSETRILESKINGKL